MASYLAIVDRRFVGEEERARDIFQADGHLAHFFDAFLIAAGLITNRRERLTHEGRAVLMMLIATRQLGDAENNVGMDWILANRSNGGRTERADAADKVERAEQVAGRMLHRFATDTIDGLPSVKLIGLHITNEIPVRSTLWTMSWPAADREAIIADICRIIPDNAQLLVRQPWPEYLQCTNNLGAGLPLLDNGRLARVLPGTTLLPLCCSDDQITASGEALGLDMPGPESTPLKWHRRAPLEAMALWSIYLQHFSKKKEMRELTAAFKAWHLLERVKRYSRL
jgi:hypothetical protein